MKRIFSVAAGLGLALCIPAHAQVDAEDVRRLNGTVEALSEGQEALRKQIRDLRDTISQLRQENAHLKQQLLSSGELVNRDQLKEVVKSVQLVDEKRAADADYVKRQLDTLAKDINKSLTAPPKDPVRPKTPPPAAASEPAPNLPDKMYVHKVAEGDSLGAIIAAYNKEYGLKVKTADILAANPKLKSPKNLRVGQELNIPAVK